MKKTAVMNASIGFVLWLIFLFMVNLNMIEQLLLFAIFVTVPLTLYMSETVKRNGVYFKTYIAASYLHLPMAVMAGLSFITTPGLLAGYLSFGWLAFSVFVFFYGFVRFSARGIRPLEELSIDIGLIYFLLGGAWFVIGRFGMIVMEFSTAIIQLTAIHFHFSAFVLPIFNGMIGRFLLHQNGRFSKTYRLATFGILAGPILIAIGITYSRIFEFLSVGIFVLALILYCIEIFTNVLPKISWLPRVFLSLSNSALIVTLALSFTYGFSRALNVLIISIPNMVVFHGIGNAFVVVFCGIVGWLLINPKPEYSHYGIPASKIFSRFFTGSDFFHRRNLVAQDRHDDGLIDNMEDYDRIDFNTRNLHPEVVSFYENTLEYTLESHTQWQPGFVAFSKIYKSISKRIGQINLPLNGMDHIQMTSKIISLNSEEDGRPDVRAWIRTTADGESIFAAAYSSHQYKGERYMNIALPLLLGNMTGVLKMDHMQEDESGLKLSNFSKRSNGDEGIYYHTRWFTIKLPINEHFNVWFDEKANLLKASHHMSLFNKPFLKIDYEISRV
ncbi:YndJ family protein [Pseudalkalibacillus sp. A8]|uniref:YndJ family protein n=1 Tax=Pseudalkalibacillus sp. A8 TaxID=3382641 RepID=UPI0038B63CA0